MPYARVGEVDLVDGNGLRVLANHAPFALLRCCVCHVIHPPMKPVLVHLR